MQNMLGMMPFNLSLLILSPDMVKGLRQIKVLDIFEPSSTTFHPDGLFSVDGFGKVGDEKRNRLFGYIDLGIDVFHPLIYKKLLDLKELYGKIMEGKAYAVFNPLTKDFEASNMDEGETGFDFFLKHFQELEFEARPSTSREFAIKLVNQNKKNCLMNKLIVMPAGLRDFTIEPSGKREEDEINSIYRQILSISNIMVASSGVKDKQHLDASRAVLQKAIYTLYQYIINLLEGDSKLIQGHWTSRNIYNSTRNVITASVSQTKELFDPFTIGPNDEVVGLYQFIRSIFPMFVKLLRNYSETVFIGPNAPANLVNAKTLKAERVMVDPRHYDDWVTQEGIEGLLNRFETEALRDDVIEIEGKVFALLYRDGKQFKLFHGLEDLPEGWDPTYVKPITYAELFYIAVFETSQQVYALTTRYPVINMGGIFPVKVYLRTTTRTEALVALDDAWQPTSKQFNEFPVAGIPYFNSISPPFNHLARAGADLKKHVFFG